MANPHLGLIKSVGLSIPEANEELDASLRDFLEDRGIEEERRKVIMKTTYLEYNAEDMKVSWHRLQADLEDLYPQLKFQFTEGETDSETEEYFYNYENLEIYI